jgi:selenocysteine lyase/cysteine desulfurase
MRAYDFWTETGTADVGPYPIASLSLRPSNTATANDLQMMFPSGMPVDKQLAVADRVLAQVQRWRDGIAEAAERRRTTEDELAAAREEIARLKAERDGGDDE